MMGGVSPLAHVIWYPLSLESAIIAGTANSQGRHIVPGAVASGTGDIEIDHEVSV